MIGFKNTNSKVQVLKTEDKQVEEMIQIRGIHAGHKVLMEYFSTDAYPLLQGEDRDKFFIARLKKIRERYFYSI